MIVVVEQKHILEGSKGHCRSCPIALAIKDKLGDDFVKKEWAVLDSHVEFTGENGERIEKKLPKIAQYFIRTFDHYPGRELQPFRFRL